MTDLTCDAVVSDLCDALCAYQTGVYNYGGFPSCWETAVLTEEDDIVPVLTWSKHPSGHMYMTRVSAPRACGEIKAVIARTCLVAFLTTNAAYFKIQNVIYHMKKPFRIILTILLINIIHYLMSVIIYF